MCGGEGGGERERGEVGKEERLSETGWERGLGDFFAFKAKISLMQ